MAGTYADLASKDASYVSSSVAMVDRAKMAGGCDLARNKAPFRGNRLPKGIRRRLTGGIGLEERPTGTAPSIYTLNRIRSEQRMSFRVAIE